MMESNAAQPAPNGNTASRSASSLHHSNSTGESRHSSKRASYVPAIPSPLNPALSSASSVSSTINDRPASPIDSSSSSSSGDLPRSQRRSSSNLSPPQAILRQKSVSILRPPTPVEEPRRLNDLGRDYSRYPSSSDSRSESSRIPIAESSLVRTITTTNPLNDSQADLEKWGYLDDGIAAFHPYHGGEKGFILYAEEIEADDHMHLPRDDDDVIYKAKLSDYFNRKRACSTIGVILLMLCLACVFILLPILTFTTHLLVPGGSVGHT